MMQFTLMHGTGNRFAVLDGFRDPVPSGLPRVAATVCGRFGTDGLLTVTPTNDGAAARMRVFNADGSEAEMCGNGLRCVAALLADRRYVAGREFAVATAAGPRAVAVLRSDGLTAAVRVSLGQPVCEPARIPTTLPGTWPGTPPLDVPLSLTDGTTVRVTAVSMGNPHAVLFADENAAGGSWDSVAVRRIGPAVARHPAFPNGTNVGFARAVSAGVIELQVWERGVGPTAACGTGAAAAAVAGALSGRTGRRVEVHQSGGTVQINWTTDGELWLTGEAVTLGEVELTLASAA